MKVKTIKTFVDIHSGAVHELDSTFDVSEERYAEIQSKGNFVEKVNEHKESLKKTK